MGIFRNKKYFVTDLAVGRYETRRLSPAQAEELRNQGYLVEPIRHE